MAQVKIAVDAGHGGSDAGATFGNRKEKDDNLKLANAVGKELEKRGVDVYYVRTDDEYETPFKKATDANNSGANYFVSIHRNSGNIPDQYNGVETLVYDDSGVKAKIARNINAELEKVGYKNLGIDERPNLVVLKRTKMPAVLVEAGFINSQKDNELFDDKFNQTAKAIADGIMNTISVKSQATSYMNNQQNGNQDNNRTDMNIPNENRMDMDRRNEDDMDMDRRNENDMDMDRRNENDMNMDRRNDNGMDMDRRYDNGMDMDRRYENRMDMDRRDENRMDMDRRYENRMDMDRRDENKMEMDRRDREKKELENGEKLFRVQVGAYRNKESADRMLNALLIEGFPAFIVYDDGIYKVQVGAFRFLANAIKMEDRLRKFRYNTYITV